MSLQGPLKTTVSGRTIIQPALCSLPFTWLTAREREKSNNGSLILLEGKKKKKLAYTQVCPFLIHFHLESFCYCPPKQCESKVGKTWKNMGGKKEVYFRTRSGLTITLKWAKSVSEKKFRRRGGRRGEGASDWSEWVDVFTLRGKQSSRAWGPGLHYSTVHSSCRKSRTTASSEPLCITAACLI